MVEAIITSKGQVTIPKEIRERFGLKKSDRVRFEVEGERVILHFVTGNILDADRVRVEGPLDVRELRREFQEDMARRVVEKMRR